MVFAGLVDARTWVTEATPEERVAVIDGDDIVFVPGASIDGGCYLPVPPEEVWPWLLQMGGYRAGWYLPLELENDFPRDHLALREICDELQDLAVGDVVAGWGNDGLAVARLREATAIVYRTQVALTTLSWSITLTPTPGGTRLHARIRLSPTRFGWLIRLGAHVFGKRALGVLIAGLQERLLEEANPS